MSFFLFSCSPNVANPLHSSLKETPGKNVFAVWDVSRVQADGALPLITRVLADYEVRCVRAALTDDRKMISCGPDNVRVWRLKGGV